ncbi:MAG: hypothetical protein WAU89_15685 [Candidatus Acidiferrales bacterium]
MRKKVGLIALVAVAMASSMILTACGGGGGGGNHPTTNDLVIVPGSASIPVSQSGQFAAYLAGVGQSATWTASGGTIDNTGLFMAPSSPGSVTITATAGSNAGTTTVQVVAAQPVAVSPAALTVPAGATQTFTATPATGVTWSVAGLPGGDCVSPPFNSTTQCHGTISASGVYVAPLSPPSGQTVTITATSGANSGTAAATILFSSASLTTSGTSGQYALAFTGVDFTNGFPLDVAGSFTTSGSPTSSSGTITAGEIDINSGTAGPSVGAGITGGTFQVGALDGRTSITVLTNSSIVSSFTLQATVGSNQHALLIDFDTFATGSGTLDAQNPTTFGTLLAGNFAFGLSGVDSTTSNFFPLVVAGMFQASNGSIPVNTVTAPVNVQDWEDLSFSTPVVTNDQTLSGSYSAADSNGRGTMALSSSDLGTITVAYYITDQTHLKLVEIDTAQTYIVAGDAYSAPALPTKLTGGVALTFGGLANNASYAGGAVFTINSGGTGLNTGGAMDINNFGAGSAQNNNPITSGSYTNSTGSGIVPARFLLSLTNNKGSNQFAAYTFTSGGTTGAEIIEIDNNNNNGVQGASGIAYQQGSLNTSPTGTFALNLTGVGFAKSSGSFEQDLTGQMILATGSTSIGGTLDFNNPANNGSPFSGLPVSTTSMITTAASNGRGTMLLKASANGLPATFNLVYYIVNPTTVLLFDSDNNRVANGVMSLQY